MKVKKLVILILLILLLCGCDNIDSYNVDSYNNREFDVFIDETTCVEYFIDNYVKKGGITVRYNADGTIKVNKDCLQNGSEENDTSNK